MLATDLIFGAIILAFLGWEGYTIANKEKGDTFSERTRHYFKVSGKKGAFIFLGVFGTAAAWFVAHIVQVPV